MWDLVQVTAQYSNAVLIAVLPHVSDFAKKLDLPIHSPVSINQVMEFKCDPRRGHVGGVVILTNQFQFTFLDGRVCVYRSPQSYYSLQDPALIPKFYGKVKVKEQDALKEARKAVKRLGYTSAELHADTVPEITPPEKLGFNSVPRYRFRWPESDLHEKGSLHTAALLDVEVNASNSEIEMIVIASTAAQRPNLRVDVEPPLLKSEEAQSTDRPKAFWVNKEYALAALRAVLPQFAELVTNANIPIKIPITPDDVDLSRYRCVSDEGILTLQVYLKNGDRFNYSHGRVTAFYAHDAFFKFPDTGNPEDFLGTPAMSTNDAIRLTKEILRRLGYAGPPVERDSGSPVYSRSTKFTRYFVNFRHSNDEADFGAFEIDLQDKQVKSIYLDEPSLWRAPPAISSPMTTQTNRPTFVGD